MDIEKNSMKDIPYVSAAGRLMHAEVCTHPDTAHAIRLLGRLQSNQESYIRKHQKVMRYLRHTKHSC